MAAEDRIHGKNGLISMDPLGAEAVAPVASLNKWDLNLDTEKVRVTCFEDPNHVYVQGRPDVKGTYAGDFDPADGLIIFDMASGDAKPTLHLTPTTLVPTVMFGGRALMDAKITVDANGAVTVGGAFVAAGPWTLPTAA